MAQFLPFWYVAYILIHVIPNHRRMSSYSNTLLPINDITADFSSENIAIFIFEMLFIYKSEIDNILLSAWTDHEWFMQEPTVTMTQFLIYVFSVVA